MRQLKNGIFSLLLSLTFSMPSLANGKALQCLSVHNPSLREILEKADADHNEYLFQGTSLVEFSKDFSWWRKRKIRQLVQDVRVQDFQNLQQIEEHSARLSLALFGSNEILDRWLFQSKKERLESTTRLLIQKDILKKGLIKSWSPPPEKASAFRRLLVKVQKIRRSPWLAALALPFSLPALSDKQISETLMANIIMDGFEAHADEARAELRAQNKVEAYNTFRRLYRPIFTSLVLMAQTEMAMEHIKAETEQQVRLYIESLRRTQIDTPLEVDKFRQEKINEAYQGALRDFIQKWGEEPTEAERQLIRARIEGALNPKNKKLN